MARLSLSESFLEAYRVLPERYRRRTRRVLDVFQSNPRHPSLHFEKLSGHEDRHTIRLDQSYRVLPRREEDEEGEFFLAVDVGTHDRIYKRSLRR